MKLEVKLVGSDQDKVLKSMSNSGKPAIHRQISFERYS
jgi:hypothetical protein